MSRGHVPSSDLRAKRPVDRPSWLWIVPAAAVTIALLVRAGLRSDAWLSHGTADHAALMVASWGVLIPAGGVVARYFKVVPRQDFPRLRHDLFWWRWHRGLQYSGIALSTAALVVILVETGGRVSTAHGVSGLIVMGIGWLQVLGAWCRGTAGGPDAPNADPERPETWRGDHYDMTLRRRIFEHLHKRGGWIAIGLADLTMMLGASLAGSPGWLMGLLGLLHGAALWAILDGILRRRWVDTYTALWGSSFARYHHGEDSSGPT